MFPLFLLYSIVFFCRTGDHIPFVGRVEWLSTIRHEFVIAVVLLVLLTLSKKSKENIANVVSNPAFKAYLFLLLVAFLSIPFAVWPGNAYQWFIDFFKLFLEKITPPGTI